MNRYKEDIVSAKAVGPKVMELLRKKGFIESFSLSRNHTDMKNLMCILEYKCRIKDLSECFQVKLYLLLQSNRSSTFKEFSNGREVKIEINFSLDDQIYQSLQHCFKRWKRGLLHEKRFKLFLEALKAKYPQYIKSIIQADRYSDRYLGYDFAVKCLFDSEKDLLGEVRFNLKSSKEFLDKHVERHPEISVFTFWDEDLNYRTELEKNFFSFLIAAKKWPVHYLKDTR
jgi:hypothetical protein